jgi:Fungal chitosanase of glycosyl hydrolase group 75
VGFTVVATPEQSSLKPADDVERKAAQGDLQSVTAANLNQADWRQAQSRPNAAADAEAVARGAVPPLTVARETEPQAKVDPQPAEKALSAADILGSATASAQDKIRAAESLARAGQSSVEIVDKDGSKRTLSIELETSGRRTMVHVYAQDDQGKDHVVLRAVKNNDGSFEQEQSKNGEKVSYFGDWWSKNMADRTALVENAAPKPSAASAETDLYAPRRNEIAPAPALADATKPEVNLFPSSRNDIPAALEPAAPAAIAPASVPLADSKLPLPRLAPVADNSAALPRQESEPDLSIPPRPALPDYSRDNRDRVLPAVSAADLAASDSQRLNQLFEGVASRAGYARRLTQLDNGAVYFRAGMAVDADGSPRARHIDPYGQSRTSLRHDNGASVNAEATHYYVLPYGQYKQFGVKLGDVAAVRYGDQVRFAVFADVGPRRKLGEGSMALAHSLGMSNSPISGGTQRPEVEYLVFPRSGNGTPLHNLAHEDLGRHYLGKTYRQLRIASS